MRETQQRRKEKKRKEKASAKTVVHKAPIILRPTKRGTFWPKKKREKNRTEGELSPGIMRRSRE